jgi:hypothetical protein
MTGEKVLFQYNERTSKSNSSIEGKAFDAKGELKLEISGSWLDEIWITEVATG